jgi:hypothetical protein
MFLRGTAMTAASTLGGAAFLAGLAAGAGLTAAAIGAACLARRAVKRRTEWQDGQDEPMTPAQAAESNPSVPNPG